jgi:putative sterol carrier protein
MTVMDVFDRLVAAPPPSMKHLSTTIRFDIADGDRTRHYLLVLDQGTAKVTHRRAKADAVIGMDRPLFERLLSGRANAMAATLRGEISMEGDRGLLVALQRLMPGPSKGNS